MSLIKSMFCKHEPELIEAVAVVNGVPSGRRIFAYCGKCDTTSAFSRKLSIWRKQQLAQGKNNG